VILPDSSVQNEVLCCFYGYTCP